MVILGAGIQAASWLIGPVFLALTVVIMVNPLQTWLTRRGLPGWVTVVLLLLAVYGVILLLSVTVVVSLAQLATVLPGYATEANAILASLVVRLTEFGVGPDQLRAVVASLDTSRLVPLVRGLLSGLGGLAANLVFLLSLLLFLILESAGASRRLAEVAADRGGRVAEGLNRFAWGTRRFVGVTTVIGLTTGLIDAVVLWFLGVPLAVLWGILVFITNYIPYIGFWIGFAPPAVLSLLVGGWQLFLIVLAVFLVVNFILTSVVQPYYVGDAVDLSVTVVLVSLVLWAWLLGSVGAVLAVPLTLFVKILLLDLDPRAGWASALIGTGKPAPPAPPTTPAPPTEPVQPDGQPSGSPTVQDTQG